MVFPDNASVCQLLAILFHLSGMLRFSAERAIKAILSPELKYPKPREP
jgi:hypothetical protein